MQTVNHSKIWRRAHKLSRGDNELRWNPFRHVSWDRSPSRRETWDGAQLESQPPAADDEDLPGSNPVHHTRSEPMMGSARSPRGAPPQGTMGGASKEMDLSPVEPPTQTRSSSREETGEPPPFESQGSAQPLVNGGKGMERGLRSRKQESRPTDGAAPDEKDDKKKEPKQSKYFRHVRPKHPFTVKNQIQRTLLNSWINVLLVAAPAGIVLNYVGNVNGIVIFVINFLAIIPLAALLGFATEEIALRTGETVGGLLLATFGNAVELIVAIMALVDDQVVIVQTSLIGSILSNLLLVLGFCFFLGGLRRVEQNFNTTVAQTATSLLSLAVASVIVPTVFDMRYEAASDRTVADISRGTSVILLVVYGAYLFFQLKTHQSVFNEKSVKVPAKPWSRGGLGPGKVRQGLVLPSALMTHGVSDVEENQRLSRLLAEAPETTPSEDDCDEEEEPQLHFIVALVTLTVSTVIIALCAEFMVHSIHAVTEEGGVSEEFVGLILLPIVGNAAEHATAVTVAMKDKMDLAIGVAVGSSMQVALFLIPLLVVIGWGIGNDQMSLSFDHFQVAVLFVSVLLTNYLIADGKSHWLEGLQLICLYFIIAVVSWYYRDPSLALGGGSH